MELVIDVQDRDEPLAARELIQVLMARVPAQPPAAEGVPDGGNNNVVAGAAELWERIGRDGREYMHAAARMSVDKALTVADLASALRTSVDMARSRKGVLPAYSGQWSAPSACASWW
jgi:hypothetical protein